MPTEPEWVSKVLETSKFHLSKIKANKSWKIKDTARSLHRSVGSVCEDLQLAYWLKTSHQQKLVRFHYLHDAMEYVRSNKHEMKYS